MSTPLFPKLFYSVRPSFIVAVLNLGRLNSDLQYDTLVLNHKNKNKTTSYRYVICLFILLSIYTVSTTQTVSKYRIKGLYIHV